MNVLSVRDYRKNLSASFDKADDGERVLIRRKNTIYALVSIGSEDVSLSSRQKHKLDDMAHSLKRSWDEVKQIEAGEKPARSAMTFIDEL